MSKMNVPGPAKRKGECFVNKDPFQGPGVQGTEALFRVDDWWVAGAFRIRSLGGLMGRVGVLVLVVSE